MPCTTRLGSVAALSILVPAAASAQAVPADFAKQAAAIVDSAYPAAEPGAAVIVTRGGRVLLATGRGLADLGSRRPITPDTALRLGSITKQFTAAVILQLVAEKRVSLDDPLSRFFPDWPQPGARATIRQLLNHSSGIQDYTKIPGWMGSAASTPPVTTAQLTDLMRTRPSTAEPGQRWEYNNGGYVLLGAIIEQVTGQPWHQAVHERIAVPLGLKTLAYAGDAAGRDGARGYTRVGDTWQPAQGVHISVAHAAGGLVASVRDLARWAQALHHGRVVDPALYAEMIRPVRLADGSTRPYGFGLRLRAIRGRPALVHGGAGRGLDADSLYVPSADTFVAVLANSDTARTDPAIVTRRLAALALGQPIPVLTRVAVAPQSVEPLLGSYAIPGAPPRRFLSRGGTLFVGSGDDEVAVVAAGENRFFLASDPLTWFRINPQPGGAHLMEWYAPEASEPLRATRTGAVPTALTLSPELLQRYAGRFATEGPLLIVALDAEGHLTIGQEGRPSSRMRAVSDTEFRLEDAPMRVVFTRDGGAVDRLTVYRGARELHGRRVRP